MRQYIVKTLLPDMQYELCALMLPSVSHSPILWIASFHVHCVFRQIEKFQQLLEDCVPFSRKQVEIIYSILRCFWVSKKFAYYMRKQKYDTIRKAHLTKKAASRSCLLSFSELSGVLRYHLLYLYIHQTTNMCHIITRWNYPRCSIAPAPMIIWRHAGKFSWWARVHTSAKILQWSDSQADISKTPTQDWFNILAKAEIHFDL